MQFTILIWLVLIILRSTQLSVVNLYQANKRGVAQIIQNGYFENGLFSIWSALQIYSTYMYLSRFPCQVSCLGQLKNFFICQSRVARAWKRHLIIYLVVGGYKSRIKTQSAGSLKQVVLERCALTLSVCYIPGFSEQSMRNRKHASHWLLYFESLNSNLDFYQDRNLKQKQLLAFIPYLQNGTNYPV